MDEKKIRERKLFEEIKVTHGIPTIPSEEVDKKALEEWMQTHDHRLTIDEIDAVIEEVKNGQ